MTDANFLRLPELLKLYPEIEYIELSTDMPTAEKAAEICGMDLSSIAKTLIIKTDKEFIALILLGPDRINEKEVKAVANCKKFRFASSEEVLNMTSYPAGGTPPIGLGSLIAKVFVDRKVLEKTWVIAGGGDRPKLIKISPKLICELSQAKVVDIASGAK